MTKQELAACIERCGKDVYSYCRYLALSREDANELYQDTFLRALELHSKINAEENPRGFLLAVATRLWKNRRRKMARRANIAPQEPLYQEEKPLDVPSNEPQPEEQLIASWRKRRVRQEVQHLPEHLKLPVLLYYMEGLSVAQTAAALHIPPGTVKSRLHSARKRLEVKLYDVMEG